MDRGEEKRIRAEWKSLGRSIQGAPFLSLSLFLIVKTLIDSEQNEIPHLPVSAARPEREVILSNRAEPPALILASRRSRRMRACFCIGDSSPGGGVGWFSMWMM